MKDTATMPLKNENKGKKLFSATFRLYKLGNFVMEDKVEILANNKQHFISRFGYQNKLQQSNAIAAACNYSLEILISEVK